MLSLTLKTPVLRGAECLAREAALQEAARRRAARPPPAPFFLRGLDQILSLLKPDIAPSLSEELHWCTMARNLARHLFRRKSSKALRRGMHLKCKISSISSCWPCFLGDCIDANLAWKLTCMKSRVFPVGTRSPASLQSLRSSVLPSPSRRRAGGGSDGRLVREPCRIARARSCPCTALLCELMQSR